MTQIVPVAPGFSEVVASGPQYGVKYVLTGMQGDGTRVVFNDPQDADYVGMLTNISGLDSPDVRESADDLIGDDGGVHGNFFHGRRPIVLEGMIDNRPSFWMARERATILRTNLFTNPVFATALAPVAAANTPVSLVQSSSLPGTPPLGITTGFFLSVNNNSDATWANVPLTLGKTYTWSLYAYSPAASAAVIGLENPYTGAITDQGGITWIKQIPAARDTWERLAVTFTATDTVGNFRVGNVGSSANGYFTGWMLEETPDLQNFFAPSVGNGPPSFRSSWTGTANASTSTYNQIEVVPYDAAEARNLRMTALQRVTNAMRKDMQMRWQVQGGVEQMLMLRRQQPLRISGGFNKSFQAALVAADPRIYASAIQEVRMNVGVQTTIRNNGSIRTQPVATIFGPTTGTMTAIELHNHSTGEFFVFAPAYGLTSGQYIVIDFANKTVTRESGANIYDQVQFASTLWWQLEPSDNLIELHGSGTTTNANCVLRWQDAWV